MSETPPKLGIVAGAGELPLALARACAKSGRPCHYLAVEGLAVAGKGAVPSSQVSLGQLGRAFRALRRAGCREVVFAGKFHRPQSHGPMKVDAAGARFLWRNRHVLKRGDDAIHRAIAAAFRGAGFTVVSPLDVAPELAAPEGVLTTRRPTPAVAAMLTQALAAARAHGAGDEGQGVIYGPDGVLAREGCGGTDAMLRGFNRAARDAVLVKAMKPNQLRNIDPPAVGENTVALAARAGLTGIAVEAGHTVIVNREAVAARAEREGLFLVGLPRAAAARATVMLVAGEPSGDALGAELIAALRSLRGEGMRIVGVGGPQMRAAGLFPLYGLDDTAVMGLREVVPKVPAILKRVRQARDLALEVRPDITVLIDSPDFTNRVAKAIRARDRSLRLVKYVAPQVWASRSYRVKQMKEYFDHVLCLLPFEPEWMAKAGLAATFVGHPVIERGALMTGGAEFRLSRGIAPGQKLLLVLPGSRRNEIRFILPAFRDAVKRMAKDIPGLVCVLPTVPNVAARVREAAQNWPTPLHIVEGAEKFRAFAAADAALAASGTVTTELALARVPMVTAYRAGWLTAAIARPFINVKYITLVNLILGREAVPEYIQENCTGAKLAPAVVRLLTGEPARQAQIAAFEEAAKALGEGGEAPSLRAARAVLGLIAAF